MDVRLFAFLARQPSAAIQPRAQFCGLPTRGLAFLLANVMFWQPLWAQAADAVVVSAPGTGLAQAGNGVPIINIAAPNGAGLSHNRFSEYNVGQQGLILNNVTGRTEQTQLGGIIVGNPNFQGTAASTILNEVNGASPSQLRGYTEVAGQSARVIVANPHGITCDGCGFINTPQVTLTTGKPVIEHGQLTRYQVDQGSVSVDGDGLNASNVDQFEIITRATQLNAQIQANRLTIVAGRNDVDERTLAATARAADGSAAPALAIDSSALGGMYAGAITLVGTEAGVGVKLAGNMVAGGDIQIDVNGQLTLAQTSAGGAISATAGNATLERAVHAGTALSVQTQGALASRNNLTAGNSISLDSVGQLVNHGIIEAGINTAGDRNSHGDVRLKAQSLVNDGKTVIASRDLALDTEVLSNLGGTLSGQRQVQVDANQFDNQSRGRLLSAGTLAVTADQLHNSQGGLITANGRLAATVGQLVNRNGELSSLGEATLLLENLDNVAGLVSAAQMSLLANGTVLNHGGRIDTTGAGYIDVASLDNSQAGAITSEQGLHLDLNQGHLDNHNGLIKASGQLTFADLVDVDNREGEISSLQAFTVAARSLDNTAGKLLGAQRLTLQINQSLSNGAGLISAHGLQIAVASLINDRQGNIASRSDLQLRVTGRLDNRDGSLGSVTAQQVHAGQLDNRGGRITSADALGLVVDTALLNQQGQVLGSEVRLSAGTLDNSQGRVQSDDLLVLDSGVLDNRNGRLVSGQDLQLSAARLDNTSGTLSSNRALTATLSGNLLNLSGLFSAGANLQLVSADLNNQSGQLSAGNTLQLRAAALDNSQAGRISGNTVHATVRSLDQQADGRLFSQGGLTLDVTRGHLHNRGGLINAPGQLLLVNLGSVDNQGGEISSATGFELVAERLDNTGGKVLSEQVLTLRIAGVLENLRGLVSAAGLDASVASLTNHRGTLSAGSSLTLAAQHLDNTAGRLTSDGELTAIIAEYLRNQAGLIAASGNLALTLDTLDNQGQGRISSQSDLTLAGTTLDNRGGNLAAAGLLDINADSLDNRQGSVHANQHLDLTLGNALSNQQGSLRGDNRLDLKAGQVDNSTGGRISAGQRLTASVTGLDQHDDGRLFSQGDVSLDLNHGHLNNRGGVINAPGQLLLRQLAGVDNRSGEISSARAFNLHAASLLNNNAKLLSEQTLTLRIAQALDNTSGLISANGLDIGAAGLNNLDGSLSATQSLLLRVDGGLNNQKGDLGARSTTVTAGSFDNRQGKLTSDDDLSLQVAAEMLNQTGVLEAGGALRLTAGQVDNSQGGHIRSQQQLDASLTGLDQRNDGRLYSQAGVSLDLNHGHLNNQGGVIHAPGTLLLSNLASVDNQRGEISSAQALTFAAQSLGNRSGKLLSEQRLLVRIAQALDNSKGLISATGLDLHADSLLNIEGSLIARDDLTADVRTLFDNQKGNVLATRSLLSSASLDNTQGLIQGDELLTLTQTGVLTNHNGRLVTGETLSLNAGSLDNTQGRLSSEGVLNAVIRAQLINQAGLMVAGAQLHLTAAGLDNQAQGRLAGASMTLLVDQFDNRSGSVASAGELQVSGTHLDNRSGGLLNAGQRMKLTIGSLDNRGGEVSGLASLSMKGSHFDNSEGGRLLANGDLTLTLDHLDNRFKGIVSGQQAIDLRTTTLNNSSQGSVHARDGLSLVLDGELNNQQGGRLTSAGALTLDMNEGHLNNAGGLLSTPGPLVLKNLTMVTNRQGEMSSRQAFGLSARTLDNSGGIVLSEQALSLTVDGLLTNLVGQVSGAGLTVAAAAINNSEGLLGSSQDLKVTVGGALLNTDGEVSSAGASEVRVGSLSNLDGQVTGDVSLDLTSDGALLNHGGTLGAGQRLNVVSASLDNSQAGSLVTDGTLDVRVTGLLDNQSKGSLLAKGAMDVHAGTLDNRQGVIAGRQTLTLGGERLHNQQGLINASGPLQLTLDALNNSKGRIASQDTLGAVVGVLTQQGGELVAEGALTLTVDDLDNRNGGLVGTTKALKLQGQRVDNRGGEISSQQSTEFGGAHLDNSGGKLLAGTLLQVRVSEVINQAKGLLFAQQLNLEGARLNNQLGSIAARQEATLVLTEVLDNAQGRVGSEGTLKVTGKHIDNNGGSLSSAAALTVTSTTAFTNVSGVVETAKTLELTSASLDNREQGLLKSEGSATLTTGTLDNTLGGRVISAGSLELNATQVNNDGRIASVGALDATLTGLTQQGGELHSSTQVNLDLSGGNLLNAGLINAPLLMLKNLGSINNQRGEISSQNAFSLTALDLDNSHGKIISNQGLTLRIGNVLSNLQGSISAVGIDSQSTRLINTDGLISSRGALTVTARELLDNQRGTLVGDGRLLLTSVSLDNRSGEIAGKSQVSVEATDFDNRKGQLISTDTLHVNATRLDNQGGLAGATKALTLAVDTLDNRAGELAGNADVIITGQRLDNSDGGQVFAVNRLALAVGQVINRNRGQLSAQRLTLESADLDNSGGSVISQEPLVLELDGDLLNAKGLLSTEGTLVVKARNLDNTEGSLSSADGLELLLQGGVNNLKGELVTDGALLLSSTHLDNQQGSVSGKRSVSVDTGALNNTAGRLSSGGALTLTTAQLDNGGTIASAKALTATVSGLDQQGGKLVSNEGLTLDVQNGVLNNQNGLINAVGPLHLKNLGSVDNQRGEISSAEAFSLIAHSLNNSQGRVLSNQGLTLRIDQALTNIKGLVGASRLDLRAASSDNSGGILSSRGDLLLTTAGLLQNQNEGLINSQGTLTLTAGALDTGSGGEVSGKGTLNLDLGALNLDGGRIVGQAAVTLDLNDTDLDNRNGLIFAAGPLTLEGLRAFDNRNGELSSQQNLALSTNRLNNSGGKLISSQVLTVTAAELINQGGLISGWQGLDVTGTSLDNRNKGTLSSRSGALDVQLTGALLNSGEGALVSQGLLSVGANSLDNSGGILSSAAAQQLVVAQTLNNANGGLIDSGTGLEIAAATLDNQRGTVNAQQALRVTGTHLHNERGTLLSNGRLTLNLLGRLGNTSGKVASAGPLLLERADQVVNQDGQIVSQGLLTLVANAIDNSQRGTLAATGRVSVSSTGAVLNSSDGLIYSQGEQVHLGAASLNNDGGRVQGQSGLSVEVGDRLDNQGGTLLAQTGDVMVRAKVLDNRDGTLASLRGLLDTRVGASLLNGRGQLGTGGVVQGQRLSLVANSVDNQFGRVAAQQGDAIVNVGQFNNAGGGLYAGGLLRVDGTGLDNSGGQMAAQQIVLGLGGRLGNRGGIVESDSSLSVSAGSVDNQGGQVRALGAGGRTGFQIGGLFDNQNGRVEVGNSDLAFAAGGFQNLGGSLLHGGAGAFDISLANLTNAGGTVVSRGGLTVVADSWTNSSVIQVGRLNLEIRELVQTGTGQLLATNSLVGRGGNWVNDGLIASDGTIDLDLSGRYSGSGRASSLGQLALDAGSIELSSLGSIAAADDVVIGASGALGAFTNAGRVTSAQTLQINSGQLTNTGTLAGAGGLQVTAGSLVNESGGLLFAGGAMRLGVDSLVNKLADVYGAGDIVVEGRAAGSRAAEVRNMSGQLESLGNFALYAGEIVNERKEFKVDSKLYSSSLGIGVGESFYRRYVLLEHFRTSAPIGDTPVGAGILAGKNLLINADTFSNRSSNVSSVGNLDIVAGSVENQGAALGDFARATYIDVIVDPFLMYSFNSKNDAYYNRDFWMIDGAGVIMRQKPVDRNTMNQYVVHFGPIVATMNMPGMYERSVSYSEGVRVELPNSLNSAPVLDEKIIATEALSYLPAVIQAGNKISISASAKLGNGVEQVWAVPGALMRTFSTSVSDVGTSVVTAITRHLAPDLAQREVNPLTLPGFSLPTGQNGLFRLSGQSSTQTNQANPSAQSWTLGGTSVALAQRQQNLPGTQGRTFQVQDVGQLSASARQVSVSAREANGIDTAVSAVNVDGTGATGTWQPGRSATGGMTQGATGAVAATQADLDLSTLTPAERAALAAVNGQSSGYMPGDRGVSVTSRDGGSIRPDLAVPDRPTTQRDVTIIGSQAQSARPEITPLALAPLNTARPTAVDSAAAGSIDFPEGATLQQPTPVATQRIDRVQGLPTANAVSQPHKYLIETNPVLTELTQFMSSDYLLAGLGYDPDQSAKRLGDGLYEQRLIRQAVIERTGQRFIAGQNTDKALFKYLMDNALSSKQRLNLALGVTLTSQQVAALTHDIVWLEEHEVNGEKVLVPVVYLAQADNRLAPNGALIAGNDVTLIAGEDLSNAGTLRASNNLVAKAGNDLTNLGLIEAGNRLELLAGNKLVNKAGGLISGRDVTLMAVNGDVINERTVSSFDSSIVAPGTRGLMDSAGRIEAANDLSLKAGRDVRNMGAELSSARDLTFTAGRDVQIESVEHRVSSSIGSTRSSQVTQHGSSVQAGRDLGVTAGRDFTAIASRIDAQRNVDISAANDLTVTSAANEEHFYARSKKVIQSRDQITQVSSVINAGGDLSLDAGRDMAVIASRITGARDLDLDAARDLTIASDQDESASFYQKKSKGSFGRKSSYQNENYQSTNIASVIEAGGDLRVNVSDAANGGIALDGGRDVTVIGSQLKAGGDLMVGATGDVAVLSGIEEHGQYSKKTKSGFLGLSGSGKSQLQTTATQVGSELQAGNDIVLAAGSDVRLRASEANAGNDVELRSGLLDKDGDIDLLSANDTAYSRTEEYKRKLSLSMSAKVVTSAAAMMLPTGPGTILPSISFSSAKVSGQEAQSSTSVGSQVLAENNALLDAERDINLVGSGVTAGGNVSLNAGRDVSLAAAGSQNSTTNWSKTSQVGLRFDTDDNGISGFAGAEKEKARDRLQEDLASGSAVQAGRDLEINAGRDINQRGSDLVAGNDINLSAGRDINIDAAPQVRLEEQQREYASSGIGGSINHNAGKTKDAINRTGEGEDGVSKASSGLQTLDAISQFLAGPTADGKTGNSTHSSSVQRVEESNRSSSLEAGNDINLKAGNGVNVEGSHLQAGRDILIKGTDVSIDVAKGSSGQQTSESKTWGGINGGTTGGFKVGIGASNGTASADGVQGTSTPSQLEAGRDVKVDASNDVNVSGSHVKAGRDIELTAGNDVTVRAAQNDSLHEQNRRNAGGEVGLTFGSEGVGVYASINMGKGDLEREAQRHQEAYLYAGDKLNIISGGDTTVAGAQLRADEVVARVGRDLHVASAVDTGKVKGKEFDVSVTVTVGPGAGVSGSVGYGETTGKTEWVQNQTRISGASKVDIHTGNHTQLDGAVIAADNGNLKLDTGTLGYSDIAGKDQEHGYYLNVGGSYKQGKGTTQQDPSQTGKGKQGETGWSVTGWEYEKEREQIVRATVGAGEIAVRGDGASGQDSTAGLNRDLDKAYEITRDEESRTDLYVTDTSLHDAMNPKETLQKWEDGVLNYHKTALRNLEQAAVGVNATVNRVERLLGRDMAAGALQVTTRDFAEDTLEQLIIGGKSRSEAMAMMESETFQNDVLRELNRLWTLDQKTLDESRALVDQLVQQQKQHQESGIVLDPTVVGAERLTLLQDNLRSLASIKKFIDGNQDKAQAIGVLLALTQGPKGVIQAVAISAAEQTPLGQRLMERLEALDNYAGQSIAEYMEGKGLSAGVEEENYLLGGGKLAVSILGTGISSIGGGKGSSISGHGQGGGTHTPKDEGGGPKATGAVDVPATSSIARDGLRNDLAVQAGIPRSLDKVWGSSIDDLAQAYKMDGATLVPKPHKPGTSGNAQAFTVEGHPAIKEVQYHSGGGRHDTEYYKFTYKDGTEVRVIDSSAGFKPGTITKYQQYYDKQGNRLKYEAGQWKAWE